MKYLNPDWPAPSCIKAYTTIKSAWGSPEHPPKATASMQQLEQLLHLPTQPIWITQTHGTVAIEAIPAHTGHEADASFTTNANHVCVVLTADCLPLLICNKEGSYVAAIHAGWRGLAGGIIESTLRNAPHPLPELMVWLGPAIGPSKFEVGPDVYEAFTKQHPDSALAFTSSQSGKWLADLYQLARLRLNKLGITAIYGGDYCTYTQADLFYSYRRDHGKTGRMASLIWIES